MRQLLTCLLGIVLLTSPSMVTVNSQPAQASTQKRSEPGAPVEEFSFLIKDFQLDHQTEHHNLNISISYRYVANITKPQYPDFRWLAKDVETFLTNYPNEDDYWEIVNKEVTSMLMRKYTALASLTCEFKVDPSGKVPYTRSSRVTRTRR
ncbi:MAG TPA: hypothetical protein VFM63_12420 [Pyrinomonadaceae bacterium]|nr:hypothetical protein [Pyrinomonadaceae bacterium]